MNNKKIISLTDAEHVLQRPTIYIGAVESSEERIPIVVDGKTILEDKTISVGFYKLLNEVVDNAFDEAKRCKGRMDTITVEIFTSTNRVIVTDTGDGFHEGYEINDKTGVSNIETAMSQLRAGSNFNNETATDKLIGTNGVGAAIVNILSESFEVKSGDGKKTYTQQWERFVSKKKLTRNSKYKGTVVDFTPRADVFVDCVWDKDIIISQFIFRNYIKDLDPQLRKLKVILKIDNERINLNVPFYNENDAIEIRSNKYGKVLIWESFHNSTRLSFINGQLCSGIHQKIVQDHLNEIFKDDRAHEFYDTLIAFDLEPKDVTFGDQNKTKFVAKRNRIEPIYDKYFKSKVKSELKKSKIYANVLEKISERKLGNTSKQIDKLAKTNKIELSDKYYPANKKKEYLFLVEGNSAMKSILQGRDPSNMGFYALRGKIPTIKKVSDLTNNKELAELIQIIGLDITGKSKPKYDKIIIATDADTDGGHISTLIINFFYTWFPYIIESGKLFKFMTPLVTGNVGNKVHRFYTLEDYKKSKYKMTNIRYLKGLGSLSIPDWVETFKEFHLMQFVIDDKTAESIEIAFGDDTELRKRLYEGER